jgi:hypothetical protein
MMQESEGLKIKLDEGVKKIGGGVKRKASDEDSARLKF